MYPKDYRTGDEFDCKSDQDDYEYRDNESGEIIRCPTGPNATKEDQDQFFENKRRNN